MNKIYRCFFDTDLRNGHDGLTLLAIRNKINLKMLDHGEFVVFINRRRNALKLFAANNVIAHYRQSHIIDLNTIRLLPTVFNGTEIKYDTVLEKVLKSKLRIKNAM